MEYVNFSKFSGSNATDATQTIIRRMIEKNHPLLFGEQSAFENYVSVSAKKLANRFDQYDMRKGSLELWEIQDITPAKKIADEIGLDELPLNDREKNYLNLYLKGEKNNNICSEMKVSKRTGKNLKKSIIDKLKSNPDKAKLWAQNDPSELHGIDISDLRYRKVYSKDHNENKRIKQNENEVLFCSLAPYCPLPLYDSRVNVKTEPTMIWITFGRNCGASEWSIGDAIDYGFVSKYRDIERTKEQSFCEIDDYCYANPADIRIRYR